MEVEANEDTSLLSLTQTLEKDESDGNTLAYMDSKIAWGSRDEALFEQFTPFGLDGVDERAADELPVKKGLNLNAMRGERAFRIVSRLNEEQIALSVPNKAQITVFRMKQKVSEKLEIPVDRQQLLFQGVPLEDSWSVEDLPITCTTLFLELKPEKSVGEGPRKLMDISYILDDAAWDDITEKAAFGTEADMIQLEELRDKAERDIATSESTRMTWEDAKHIDVLDWMSSKIEDFQGKSASVQKLKDERSVLKSMIKKDQLQSASSKRRAQALKVMKEVEQRQAVFYENQKAQIEAHKSARLIRLVREQKLNTAADQFIEDTVAFVIFAIVYTIISLVNRRDNAMVYRWGQQLKGQIQNKWYEKIEDLESMWDYIQFGLIPALAKVEYYNNELLGSHDQGFVLLYNKILGPVRIRQVRGSAVPCSIGPFAPQGMLTVVKQCYDFDPSNPDEAPLVKGGITYSFRTAEELNSHSTTARTSMSWYPGSGYVEDLRTNNMTYAAGIVGGLRKSGWTDLSTRALFVQFNLYNPTIEKFSVVNVMLEMPLQGGVVPSVSYSNVRLFKYNSAIDFIVLGLEMLMVLQLLDFIRMQVKRVQLVGRKEYFNAVWPWFDMVNTGTLWIVVQFRIQWLFIVWQTDFNTHEYLDLKSVADVITLENSINSLNALLIYMRAFKFLSLWPRMQKFKDTLRISVPNILAYWLNISVIFFAFACTGFVAFGRHLKCFHTLGDSLLTMFIYASGQYNFDDVKAVDPLLGPFITIAFMCLVYFCLTCMFMAINCHTYNIVIRGLHISKDSMTKSLDGPELMNVTYLKCRDWLEQKIPSAREAREEKEMMERRARQFARSKYVDAEALEKLAENVKALIEITGPVEAHQALGKYDFYRIIIEREEKFDKKMQQYELDEIMESIKQAIYAADAHDQGEMLNDVKA